MRKADKDWLEDTSTTSIVDIVYDYTRHWKWFIASLIFCLLVGVVFILTTQKEYKPSISVLLNEDKSKGGSSSTGIDFNELGLLSTTSNIDNEIAILTSFDLMRSVVDTLNLTSSYYINNTFKDQEVYAESPFFVTFTLKNKEYPDDLELDIIKGGNDISIKVKYTTSESHELVETKQLENFPLDILLEEVGLIQIKLTNQEFIDQKTYKVVISSPTSATRKLNNSLFVNQTTKSSSVLNLNLLVNNTSKGARILEELVRQYNMRNIRVNNRIAYNTALFINERLRDIAAELSDVERNVVNYKQQHSIANLASEAQMSIQQSGQNKERLMEIETQLNVIEMVNKFVNDPVNKLKLIPNLGISDPALSQIINEYNNKLLSSEALLQNTGDENPMRIRVIEEMNNMHSSISSSLDNVKQAYLISKKDMQSLSGSTMAHIRDIPQQEKGLLERVRQQQVKESLFLFLMQKREETNISIASISDKAQIINSPQTAIPPVAPKVQIILLASIILGLLVPIIVIYVMNLFHTKITNRAEFERICDVSIVGQINKSIGSNNLIVHSNLQSDTAELFRLLRNNLNFILKNAEHKIILITSTMSTEGKTFISVNLAMTYTLSNKKVLLVGGDLRKPQIKKYLDVDVRHGLSDYLAGSTDENWKDYVIKSDLSPNLDLLISGTIPPNPNELLMTPKLKSFMSEAKSEYDIVIIDTAPVGMVSDTYLFDEYIGLTLYVVREGVTPKDAIPFINAQKDENKLQNLYVVLNDSVLNKHYGYGY